MQHTPYYYVKLPLIGQSRINYLQATRETNHLGALGPILLGFFSRVHASQDFAKVFLLS